MIEVVTELADAANNREIMKQAITVCKWIGWLEVQGHDLRAVDAVRTLKRTIEGITGREIEEYT